MSAEAPVLISNDNGIVLATMNRPERKNALNYAAYQGLIDAIGQTDADPAARALVITGAGDNFTSGNDIADFAANPAGARVAIAFLHAITAAQKPVIAAVEGYAVGIGTTMLLHCDFAYAGHGARLRMPFINLGLTPEGGSSLLVPAFAGAKRAAELLLLGEEFTAATAAEAGIITRAVEDGTALPAAMDAARKLAALPAEAVRQSKALLRRSYAALLTATIEHEGKVFGERLASPEAQAAFLKFLSAKKG
jgi:enoyl-CoA hydratase/carnithine racemase